MPIGPPNKYECTSKPGSPGAKAILCMIERSLSFRIDGTRALQEYHASLRVNVSKMNIDKLSDGSTLLP